VKNLLYKLCWKHSGSWKMEKSWSNIRFTENLWHRKCKEACKCNEWYTTKKQQAWKLEKKRLDTFLQRKSRSKVLR